MWLVKTDSNGLEEWNKTYGGTGGDSIWSFIMNNEGDYLFAGHTSSFNANSRDIWLIKTDSNGLEEWNKTFDPTDSNHFPIVIETSDGGFTLVMHTFDFDENVHNDLVIKTDDNGFEQWNHSFGGFSVGERLFLDLIEAADGGFILAGGTDLNSAGGLDMWLVKIIAPSTGETSTTTITTQSSTTSEDTTTTPSWTSLIVFMSVTVIVIRKRMRHS
jgi:hypothetical protein